MNAPASRTHYVALRESPWSLTLQHGQRCECGLVCPSGISSLRASFDVGLLARALIRVDTEAPLEVLGLVDQWSPNPRRNTSNETVEVLRSGDKEETCFRLVSTLSPLLGAYPQKADTKRKQGGYMSPLSNDLTSTFCW
jgi:hypothetical protein